MVTRPMDLSTLLWRVDDGKYSSLREFVGDLGLIPAAARQYHDEEDVDGQRIISRAHQLDDMVRIPA